MFNKYSWSKTLLLITCVIAGSFYCATVFAYVSPVADAGPDQNLTPSASNNENFTTQLNGAGYDSNPGGYITAFNWNCNEGFFTSKGFLSNPNIAKPIFTMPVTTSTQNVSYTCKLTVTDNFGQKGSDTMIINVYANTSNEYLVQTLSVANNFSGQATLYGSIASSNKSNYSFGTTYVWFEWGTTNSYGYQTKHNAMAGPGVFSQHIADLKIDTVYHFRAVSQLSTGKIYYGQDMTFKSNAYGPNIVVAGGTYGSPTSVSTGITNDLLKDSFFLPLLVVVLGFWVISARYNKNKAQRKLQARIARIKNSENL